jgi:hypothetical protein
VQALELFRRSLQKIGRTASEQEITGDMGQTAIRYYNDLLASKSYYALGHTEIANTSDEITLNEYAIKWATNALALEMADEFGALESYGTISDKAEEGWSTVLIYVSRIGPPQLHGNTPYGSGNKTPGNWTGNFYPETDDGILTEANAEIVVEDGT